MWFVFKNKFYFYSPRKIPEQIIPSQSLQVYFKPVDYPMNSVNTDAALKQRDFTDCYFCLRQVAASLNFNMMYNQMLPNSSLEEIASWLLPCVFVLILHKMVHAFCKKLWNRAKRHWRNAVKTEL